MAKTRGVFERPDGSGIWWIHYYENGRRHREKVGRKSDAIALYQKRKSDARAGIKLPKLRRKIVTVSDIIDDAVAHAKSHNKDKRNPESRGKYLKAGLGHFLAEELTPQDISTWLEDETDTPATYNRYKSLLSKAYKLAIANGTVTVNPARLVSHKPEPAGRIRYLSYEEYDRLLSAIDKICAEHREEFIVSVHTGMRLSEQYTCEWGQLHGEIIQLDETKNGYGRSVHLNPDALAAIKEMGKRVSSNPDDRIFPRAGEGFDNRHWFNPCLELATVESYHWHINRHTFCSWLAMNGASIKDIQELAGHKTISMSARYAHLSPDHKKSVIDRISRDSFSGRTGGCSNERMAG